jgi:peptidoglycan/xylan/chitin deacetylase (PgdA/CDA1 family)
MKPMSIFNRWTNRVFAKIAFPLLRRVQGVNPLAVYYHIVSDTCVPHVDNLYIFRNAAQFSRDLDVFARFYRPLALPDFLACLKTGTALPKNSLLLTFDDGVRECHEVIAPILKRKGFPATFFLCSAFVDNREWPFDFKKSVLAGVLMQRQLKPGQYSCLRQLLNDAGLRNPDLTEALLDVDYPRNYVLDPVADLLDYDLDAYLKNACPYLTSDQVRELLKEGHAIGAHSVDHPRYGDLTLDEQLRQTRESVRFVKERFSLGYGALAFPSSDANISRRFFREIMNTGEVDVCFGNHGLLDDCVPRCIQRTTMEKTRQSTETILGENYARRLLKRVMGKRVIQRPLV